MNRVEEQIDELVSNRIYCRPTGRNHYSKASRGSNANPTGTRNPKTRHREP